jgi:hypothetical protein
MMKKFFSSSEKKKAHKRIDSGVSSRGVSRSSEHEHAQVVFQDTSNDGSKAAEMGRELFAFPKPETKETMADYLNNHKDGDVFPYIAVTGKEEETKDSRLARMRAFVSPYNKSVKPEMRINGVVLDMLVGSLHIDDLKSYVDQTRLTKAEKRENKSFRNLEEHVFTKPYVQLRKVTGEFVPLLSGTADYTDLVMSLQDGRLLDNQVIVQSNKLPTNSSGIFELSCDYCIPTKDIRQLSIKYELARPIMKEDFQWGSVSFSISISESDTPYLTPKVEAMAVVRAPYTAMEEVVSDPDHKDVTYTSSQIKQFRQLYGQGDIADNDEPMKEKLKKSSYSKSSMRGGQKALDGPSHLGDIDGWGQLKGMKKPLLGDGEASIDAASEDEDDIQVTQQTKDQWEIEQEKVRKQIEGMRSSEVQAAPKKSTLKSKNEIIATEKSVVPFSRRKVASVSSVVNSESDISEINFNSQKKRVGFNVEHV